MAVLEEKERRALRLDPAHDCLFCTHHAPDMELVLEHMTVEHSFFLPEVDFVVDVKGLLAYLGEKVSVHHVCLYCGGGDHHHHHHHHQGKAFHSLEAVRKHMVSGGDGCRGR